MITPAYLWSKLLKKIRLSAVINSQIHPTAKIQSGSSIVESTFDRYSFCGYDCDIFNCEVGSFCSIANNVVIGGGMHPILWVGMSPVFHGERTNNSVKAKFSTHKKDEGKRTIIGNDVWIGSKALIKEGVTIGNGAVVGMGSVVTKDVDDYTIVAGCPAKVIRKRFDEDTIHKLQEIKWWDFPDELLKEYAQYFTDPCKFIEKWEEK